MSTFRRGKTSDIVVDGDLVRAQVSTDQGTVDAFGWTSMLGPMSDGDHVIVNTLGIDLALGTGGAAFILWNLDGSGPEEDAPGHIVKMRYTPWQKAVLAAEADESEHHDALRDVASIEGMPVVVCGLHSQVPGVAAGIKAQVPDARVGYLMTDAGALPLAFSKLVRTLSEAALIDTTCTSGHAFGGELESINVHSGLAALRHAGSCDVVVAALGPGVAGTGTRLGFSSLEQGPILDAAAALGGVGIACLRISFADERPRHRGISHHSLTALSIGARERATVAVPKLPPEQAGIVADQLRTSGICDRHMTTTARGDAGIQLLGERGVRVSSMGRSLEDSPELWLAAAAAGRVAADALADRP